MFLSEKANKVLIIPDAYFGNQSGAIVTRVAISLLRDIGLKVCIYSCDIDYDKVESDGTELYSRKKFNGFSNWNEEEYLHEFKKVLELSSAYAIFSIGSITNKNIGYFEVAIQHGLKIVAKIFMQDFFCTRIYANNEIGPCTKCLDNNYLESFKNKCIINNPIDYFKTLNAVLVRYRLKNVISQFDYLIGSSNEQLSFYKKYGIPTHKLVKTPLYFDDFRIKNLKSSMGNYFVCIAQKRLEKGIHTLSQVLHYCDSSVKLVIAFSGCLNDENLFFGNEFESFIENQTCEFRFNCSWETDLGLLVSNSRGVIIPSIWPTTTEFCFLEALGLGKPVFTFKVGIHSEVIENSINGFSVPLGDFKSMAFQLMLLAKNDKLYFNISHEASKLYKRLTNSALWKSDLKEIFY